MPSLTHTSTQAIVEVGLPKELYLDTVDADHQRIFSAYNIWAWVSTIHAMMYVMVNSTLASGYQPISKNYQHCFFQLWEKGYPWTEEQVLYIFIGVRPMLSIGRCARAWTAWSSGESWSCRMTSREGTGWGQTRGLGSSESDKISFYLVLVCPGVVVLKQSWYKDTNMFFCWFAGRGRSWSSTLSTPSLCSTTFSWRSDCWRFHCPYDFTAVLWLATDKSGFWIEWPYDFSALLTLATDLCLSGATIPVCHTDNYILSQS